MRNQFNKSGSGDQNIAQDVPAEFFIKYAEP